MPAAQAYALRSCSLQAGLPLALYMKARPPAQGRLLGHSYITETREMHQQLEKGALCS